ncbi:dual specificity protein phosphatase 26 isoform X2 [Pogona vitticeps]
MAFMSRLSRSGSRAPVRRMHDDTVSHPILSVFELERLLYTGKTACNHADEVWPGLYLGDQDIAANRRELARLQITHVLNASHSKWRGGADYYEGSGICYMGIEAHDSPTFDMSPYFQPAADFIHKALSRTEGRILVHCAVGSSVAGWKKVDKVVVIEDSSGGEEMDIEQIFYTETNLGMANDNKSKIIK